MKKVLFVLSMMTVLWSCKKTNNSLDEDTQRTVGDSKIQKAKVASAGDGQWDLLGFGYDVTGQYANSASSTYPIINVEKFKLEHPTYIDASGAETGTHIFEAGQNADEFSYKLTNKTTLTGGAGKLFGGTIDFNFTVDNKFSSRYIYATYSSVAYKRRLKMIPDIALMKNYLHQGFLNHVQSLSAQQLVELYGTHVLRDIKLGGKLELIYQAETKSSTRTTAAGAGAKASFKKIFGLETDGSYTQTDYAMNFNEKAFVRTVGGNSGAAIVNTVTFNSNGTPSFTFNPAGWSSGVTDANAELIDISADGLIPIYDLIDDPAKKAAVESYVTQYLIDRQVKLTSDPIYQFYNSSLTNHLTNWDPNSVAGYPGWRYDGIDFKAFIGPVAGTVPVHMFYDPKAYDHFISINRSATYGYPNWQYYGIAFYAYSTQIPGTIPIYEYYDGRSDHFITASPDIHIRFAGWRRHGVAFYAYPK